MLGSIIGDFVGSCYEFSAPKHIDFELLPERAEITDDSILTIATAEVLLGYGDYAAMYRQFGQLYPDPMGGYGARFSEWVWDHDMGPYHSWGNGSAMRVVPVGLAMSTVGDVLLEARRSAEVTHDHPEGIKGAQATALAVYMARVGHSKDEIRMAMAERFNYDMQRSVETIRPNYRFNESCQQTVPEAIIAFLDSTDYEHAIRLAISLGGDADTIACITGGVAEAFYKTIPEHLVRHVMDRIPSGLLTTVKEFRSKFPL
jgi:ADP-ribosyl-[dinitrogen reductase] hydrolase